MTTFTNAVNTKITGLSNSKISKYELKYLPKVIHNLENIKSNRAYKYYYIECLPIGMIKNYINGMTFKNNLDALCEVTNVQLKNHKVIVSVQTSDRRYRITSWKMELHTLVSAATNCSYKKVQEKYFIPVTEHNVDALINRLQGKLNTYNSSYKEAINEANSTIAEKVNSYENKSIVTRKAVKRAILSVRKDAQLVADAFNSTLTENEKDRLIKFLKANIYSMRLYVVKGTEWDQALSEMYPDEQYGIKRRTEATENSKNTVGGYISLNSIKDAPLDIIQKITHKMDKNASFIQNKGSSKYRLNNYMLVLFLLNNYNQDGFITGKTNLYKSIK